MSTPGSWEDRQKSRREVGHYSVLPPTVNPRVDVSQEGTSGRLEVPGWKRQSRKPGLPLVTSDGSLGILVRGGMVPVYRTGRGRRVVRGVMALVRLRSGLYCRVGVIP